MSYEPPLTVAGSTLSLSEDGLLAHGVYGYAIEARGKVYIPDIRAENEGAGDVGKFINSLSARCVIANVCSQRLCGMLVRRGWKKTMEADEEGIECDVWVHPNT